jgi:hypothetical protein
MTFMDRLGAHRVGFYIEHRGGDAFLPLGDLLGTLARAVPKVQHCDMVIPVHPVWSGIIVSPYDALDRFGVPDVEGVVVGASDRDRLQALIDHVEARPPLGLLAVEDASSEGRIGLPLSWLMLRGALIRYGEDFVGRSFNSRTGVEILGFEDLTESSLVFEGGINLPGLDIQQEALLRHLAMNVSKNFEPVRASASHYELVAHARELLGLGAVAAAGAVAGATFERVIMGALTGDSLAWRKEKEAAGKHIGLHSAIQRIDSSLEGGSRLMRFKQLRNDLAHRLGDAGAQARTRTDAELYDDVAELIAWLERQDGDAEPVQLVDLDPRPDLSPQQLHVGALRAARLAADGWDPRAGGLHDGRDGTATVFVRDLHRSFCRWLIDEGLGVGDEEAGVVRVNAPETVLARALAWSWAYAEYLREAADLRAGYRGRS